MEIYTTTEARKNLFRLVEYTADSHDPIYIVGRKTKAVLLSEEDFRSIMETVNISSIRGLAESILEMKKLPNEKYTDSIEW